MNKYRAKHLEENYKLTDNFISCITVYATMYIVLIVLLIYNEFYRWN